MPVNRPECPNDPDEVAERYCMNTLPAADREAFEQHLRHCSICARLVKNTAAYLEAMRSAAQDIRKREKSD
jgi:anti-sigma-K factor RskA